jgi:hypothetical protein
VEYIKCCYKLLFSEKYRTDRPIFSTRYEEHVNDNTPTIDPRPAFTNTVNIGHTYSDMNNTMDILHIPLLKAHS